MYCCKSKESIVYDTLTVLYTSILYTNCVVKINEKTENMTSIKSEMQKFKSGEEKKTLSEVWAGIVKAIIFVFIAKDVQRVREFKGTSETLKLSRNNSLYLETIFISVTLKVYKGALFAHKNVTHQSMGEPASFIQDGFTGDERVLLCFWGIIKSYAPDNSEQTFKASRTFSSSGLAEWKHACIFGEVCDCHH